MASIDGSAFSSLGIGSGLNLSSLLGNLKQAEQAQLAPLKNQKASFQTQLSAYSKLQGAVDTLDGAADSLGKSALFEASRAEANAEGFTAQAGEGAAPGNYRVQVGQLARRQTLVTAADQSKASATEALGSAGQLTVTIGSGSDASTAKIDLAASQTSLNGIRDAIRSADIGIDAAVINDGTDKPYRLVLTASTAGKASQITVSADANSGLSGLLDYDSSAPTASGNALSEAVPAQDARLTVNGIDIRSPSNTVEDAIPGVTVALNQPTAAAEALQISRDTEQVKKTVKQFVEAYNQYRSVTDRLTAFNGEDARSGALIGDSAARSVSSRLRSGLSGAPNGGEYVSIAEIGITLQKDSTLKLDADKLDQALSADRAGVHKLLAGTGDSDGVADVIHRQAASLTQTGGLLSGAQDGLKTRIQDVQDTLDSRQDNIDASIARQRAEFERLDKTLASLNQTQTYLSRQLGQLGGSSGNGSSSGLF